MLLATFIMSTLTLALMLAAVLNLLIFLRLLKVTTTKAGDLAKTKATNWFQPLMEQAWQKTLAERAETNGNTPEVTTTNA